MQQPALEYEPHPSSVDGEEMFRASPWVSYDPNSDAATGGQGSSRSFAPAMTKDVEMDAPQISTLREDSPEPAPTRTSKFRVKLLVGDAKGAGPSATRTQAPQPESEDEDEEDEDEEEDQLIDDDEEQEIKVTPSPAISVTPSARGSPFKRGVGRGRGGGRKRGAKAGELSTLISRVYVVEAHSNRRDRYGSSF